MSYYPREWAYVPAAQKALLATGRTSPGLRPACSLNEVKEIVDTYGSKVGKEFRMSFSVSQQLDDAATELLQRDRLGLRGNGTSEDITQSVYEGYSFLSPWQYHDRRRREVSLGLFEVGLDTPFTDRLPSELRGSWVDRDRQRRKWGAWYRSGFTQVPEFGNTQQRERVS